MAASSTPADKHIVLLDGDQTLHAHSTSELLKAGFIAHPFADPGVAIQLIANKLNSKSKEWQPELIIVDVSLPKMSGFEAVRRIIGKNAEYKIPVLMMSKYLSAEDQIEASNVGAGGVTNKPLTSQAVLDFIESQRMKKLKKEIGKIVFDINYE